jgi:hypothetical protein
MASKAGFFHQTIASNFSGNLSTVDHLELNAQAFAVAIVLHRWQGSYHDVPIGLDYTTAGGGRWRVHNENGSAMPTGMPFNVAVAPSLSPNAFRSSVGAEPAAELRLDHPLLEDHP